MKEDIRHDVTLDEALGQPRLTCHSRECSNASIIFNDYWMRFADWRKAQIDFLKKHPSDLAIAP